MNNNFDLIELQNKDQTKKQIHIYEWESPPSSCIYGIDFESSSDLLFKEKFMKIHNSFYETALMQLELKTSRDEGFPVWIMASEVSLEDRARATHKDRGEAIAAYILLVLHTNKSEPSDELDESVINEDVNYGEIVAFDIRDKYLSYEVIEALKKRAEYILWKHNIEENNKYKFI